MPSMNFLSEKARKPKFELHLKIYDLNNVPLVSGTSSIKWHISSSIHAEHRGRTDRCAIANHRVDYNYSRVVSSIRIPIDKNGNLAACPIELEVLQEFAVPGARDEKMVLGVVRLNLSEYVEESDTLVSRKRGGVAMTLGSGGASASTSAAAAATTSQPLVTTPQTHHGYHGQAASGAGTPGVTVQEPAVEEGIVRRYLMQESKVNSTLKLSILMVQIDGERNYVAPPLKTAPVFGGIAGIMAGEQAEQDDAGQIPSISKPHDAAEVQDMYRRALAASWTAQPGELTADEVIESIFGGSDGWSLPPAAKKHGHASSASSSSSSSYASPSDDEAASNGSLSDDEGVMGGGTLRPSDFRRFRKHDRQHAGGGGHGPKSTPTPLATMRDRTAPGHDRNSIDMAKNPSGPERNRSESLPSLAPTLGSSDRGREPVLKRAREVRESEMREDLVAWRLPGQDM